MAHRALRALSYLLLPLTWCVLPLLFAQQAGQHSTSSGSPGPAVHWPNAMFQAGNTGAIHALALSADGRWLASGGYDNTVVLWNAITGQQEARFSGHTAGIIHLSFSPSAQQLASTSINGNIRIWDVRKRGLLYSLNLRGSGKSLEYTADGKLWAATADARADSETARIELHDAASGMLVRTISTDWVGITAMTITPDQRIIAAGLLSDEDSAPGSVHIWNVTTAQMEKSYPAGADAFSPDGHLMGWIDNTRSPRHLVISDLATGNQVRNITLANEQAIYFSSDSKQFAMTDPMSLKLKVGSSVTGELRTLAVEQSPGETGLTAAVFSADGKSLVAAPYAGSVKRWDLASAQAQQTYYGQAIVQGMAVTPDGNGLIAGSAHGMDFWDIPSGRRGSIAAIGRVNDFTLSSDGRWLATNPGTQFAGEKLAIWDLKSHTVIANFSVSGGTPVSSTAFIVNGSPLKELGPLSRSFEFTADDGKHTVWSNASPVASSADGKLMAIQTGMGGDIVVWDMVTGQKVTTLAAHRMSVSGIAFSGDGGSLLTVGQETQAAMAPGGHGYRSEWGVTLWNTTDWKPRASLQFSREGAPCAAFSPDSRRVALERAWDRVEILDARNGASLEVFAAKDPNPSYHQFARDNIVFSSDGSWVYQGAQNGIRGWQLSQP